MTRVLRRTTRTPKVKERVKRKYYFDKDESNELMYRKGRVKRKFLLEKCESNDCIVSKRTSAKKDSSRKERVKGKSGSINNTAYVLWSRYLLLNLFNFHLRLSP